MGIHGKEHGGGENMVWMIPKEAGFFDLFDRAVRNVHEGTSVFAASLEQDGRRETSVSRIKELEHANDQITHELFTLLNKTFITPFDREDIHALGSRLDDIIDLTDATAIRMVLFRISTSTDDAKRLARSLEQSAAILVEAVALLRDMKNAKKILEKCVEINTHENEADLITRQALAALFDNDHDVRDIIKWKEIYEAIEAATDRCEDVANILEGIVMKNAL